MILLLVLFFFGVFLHLKHFISIMATKSSLCRQTVWAPKPQTASWIKLVTTNNYQIHSSVFRKKAVKQSSVLLHSKVKFSTNWFSSWNPSFHIQFILWCRKQHSDQDEQLPFFRFSMYFLYMCLLRDWQKNWRFVQLLLFFFFLTLGMKLMFMRNNMHN